MLNSIVYFVEDCSRYPGVLISQRMMILDIGAWWWSRMEGRTYVQYVCTVHSSDENSLRRDLYSGVTGWLAKNWNIYLNRLAEFRSSVRITHNCLKLLRIFSGLWQKILSMESNRSTIPT